MATARQPLADPTSFQGSHRSRLCTGLGLRRASMCPSHVVRHFRHATGKEMCCSHLRALRVQQLYTGSIAHIPHLCALTARRATVTPRSSPQCTPQQRTTTSASTRCRCVRACVMGSWRTRMHTRFMYHVCLCACGTLPTVCLRPLSRA